MLILSSSLIGMDKEEVLYCFVYFAVLQFINEQKINILSSLQKNLLIIVACNFHVLMVYNTKLFLRWNLMMEEKNSILQSYFFTKKRYQEELNVFMTRCCRWKNKALFMAVNCQIIRSDFYGTALTCFESIKEQKREHVSFEQS